MSTLKTNNVQVGQSATATNNFTLYQPTSPDGTCRLAVGNSGATTSDVMTVANTGAVTFSGTVTATGGFIGAGLSLQSVQTSNFAAVKGNSYPVNTTSGAVTVTFPASPSAGDQINIFDYAGTAATYNITIDPNGGKITGGTANVALNVQRISVTFTYVNSTQGWEPVTYNAYQNLNGKSWTYFTSSGSYTVPAGVTSVRGYACGAGGDGELSGSIATAGGGGGGGGFAYGDIPVTPGQTMTVTISAGVATLAIGATTYLTGNPGSAGSGGTGGAGGTSSKHASVTNGGAYSGGAGGTITGSGNYKGAGGGSAGSPLGNGYTGGGGATGGNAPCFGGGAGIGGIGGVGFGGQYAAGGGAGGAAVNNSNGNYVPGGGGSGGPGAATSAGVGRAWNNRFTDPLLEHATSPGGGGANTSATYATYPSGNAGPGGGGGGNSGAGGDFGGGGMYGKGGLMGGGRGGGGGDGGLGGGGGGTYTGGGSAGVGGGAFVFIYA